MTLVPNRGWQVDQEWLEEHRAEYSSEEYRSKSTLESYGERILDALGAQPFYFDDEGYRNQAWEDWHIRRTDLDYVWMNLDAETPGKFANAELASHSPEIVKQVTAWKNGLVLVGGTRWLVIHGPVGRGKTHLVFALAKTLMLDASTRMLIAGPMARPFVFRKVTTFLGEVKATFDNPVSGDRVHPLDLAKSAGLYVFDDMGTEKSTEWSGEVLFDILDHRYTNPSFTLITTNLSRDDLRRRYGERLYGRMNEAAKWIEYLGKDRRA